MNITVIKALKRASYVLPFVLFWLVFNNVMEYNDLKNNHLRSIKLNTQTLTQKKESLSKLKKDYDDKLAFIEANKINVEAEREKINQILQKIDRGYSKSSIVSMDISKKFINVAKVQIRIETKFINFDLNDFEDLINAEAKRLGVVYPMKYTNTKSGLIWLIILDKKGEKSEK